MYFLDHTTETETFPNGVTATTHTYSVGPHAMAVSEYDVPGLDCTLDYVRTDRADALGVVRLSETSIFRTDDSPRRHYIAASTSGVNQDLDALVDSALLARQAVTMFVGAAERHGLRVYPKS